MQIPRCILVILLSLLPTQAAEDLSSILQKGLFEEEGNQNLPAAIQAYQALLTAHDNDRKLAATAVFRLGECYRKLGRTNDAISQYQRVLTGFSDMTQLVTLSRQNLAGLGAPATGGGLSEAGGEGEAASARPYAELLRNAQTDLDRIVALRRGLTNLTKAELRRTLQTVQPDASLSQLSQQFAELEVKQAGLATTFASDHPERRALTAQLKELSRQIDEHVDGVLTGLKVKEESTRHQMAVWRVAAQAALEGLGRVTPSAGSATSEEDEEIRRIQSLIRNSPDLINAKNESGWTPLHRAAFKGQLAVARFLLENGALPDARSNSGEVPLSVAGGAGHKAMAELLLDRGADPNAADGNGETALHQVVRKGFVSVADVLFRHRAQIDARDKRGFTPFHVAVVARQPATALALLQHKADVNATNAVGDTALHDAAEVLNVEMVKFLLEHGAEVNVRNTSGVPPLGKALASNNNDLVARVGVVTVLLEKGADVDFMVRGDTPVHLAVSRQSSELLRLLLEHKAAVTRPNEAGFTPVQFLVNVGGDPAMIPLLVKAGANPSAVLDRKSPNPLGSIPSPGSAPDNRSPLMWAISAGKVTMAAALLAAGADVNARASGDYQPTVLIYAIWTKSPELVDLVLRYKPDLEARLLRDGSTALHIAIGQGITNIVASLLKAGARTDALNAAGRSPFHQVCLNGNVEMAELLLKSGANPNLFTSAGLLPLDLVREALRSNSPKPVGARHAEILALLRQHGADESLVRKGTISVTRAGRNHEEVIFRRGTNDFNRYSLFELIAMTYRDRQLPFPDFKHVSIQRLLPDGTQRALAMDLVAALSGQSAFDNRTNDVWLEWGDRVEIPEDDHPISSSWAGLSRSWADRLSMCVERSIELVTNGRTNRFQLLVRRNMDSTVGAEPGRHVATFSLDSFRLQDVLKRSKLFAESAALTARVTRLDPITRQPVVLQFDEANRPASAETDLWLRDGDRIEVKVQ